MSLLSILGLDTNPMIPLHGGQSGGQPMDEKIPGQPDIMDILSRIPGAQETFGVPSVLGSPQQHKSPLGIGGKARDILGGIGDALLIAHGHDPSYAPKRMREQVGDALPGLLGNDPSGTIQQIMQINPELGFSLLQAVQKNEIESRKATAQINKDQVGQDKDLLEMTDRARSIASRMFSMAPNTPEDWARTKAAVLQMYKNRGITDYPEIPDERPTDPNWFENYGMTADQKGRLDETYRRDNANVAIQTGRLHQQAIATAARTAQQATNTAADALQGAARTVVEAGKVGVSAANTQQRAEKAGLSGGTSAKPAGNSSPPADQFPPNKYSNRTVSFGSKGLWHSDGSKWTKVQ